MPIYDAAMRYAEEGTPLVVLAGKEYGSGSSRDWAAKGTNLLGVRAVIAQSFERIHRSNLVGMGVLPLQFADGESAESLGLTGEEEFSITRDRERRGQGGDRARRRQGVHRAGADRHPQGGPVLPARRDPAVRAAAAARRRAAPDRDRTDVRRPVLRSARRPAARPGRLLPSRAAAESSGRRAREHARDPGISARRSLPGRRYDPPPCPYPTSCASCSPPPAPRATSRRPPPCSATPRRPSPTVDPRQRGLDRRAREGHRGRARCWRSSATSTRSA